jgi:hypothetical protein
MRAVVGGRLKLGPYRTIFQYAFDWLAIDFMRMQNGGYFAQVRKDSVALRDGLPVRPRAQLAGFAGCRGIRLITRSGRYRAA